MNQLSSGSSYSLEKLFHGRRKIIIPDMQRDYTWGDKFPSDGKNNFVGGFCDNLFSLFRDSPKKTIPLGMIYAYPNPENHYHLIDGQQRITTLFLLMGMLYKYTKLEKLKERLVSKFELEDDNQEPYLQYAIRESTLYFLSDLVVRFFLDNNNKKEVKSIKSEPWYFSEYDHDPSIKSMLGALEVIEKLINENKTLDFEDFSEWLINKITFFYFDMENREHGEEMFVVINTTGEPLKLTEDLKPLLLGDISCEQLSEQWEERETFFWKNRKSSEHTADEGVKDFLIWHIAIQTKKELPVKTDQEIKKYLSHFQLVKQQQPITPELEAINALFSAFRFITVCDNAEVTKQFSFCKKIENLSVQNIRDFPKDVIQNVFLPYLYFRWKFLNHMDFNFHINFLRRLRKNHFHNDKDFTHRKENHVDWRYVLQIIEESNNPNDVLRFNSKHLKPFDKKEIPIWYSEEENVKDNLKDRIPEIAKTLDEWEDHPDFMGDLSILLQAYLLKEGDSKIPQVIVDAAYDFAELSRIMENYKSVIDPLRTRKDEDNALFNIFRLFRVLSGINNPGHIINTNGMIGIEFSSFNRKHLALKESQFLNVIKADDTFNFCKEYVKSKIDIDRSQFFNVTNKTEANLFIKAWVTLKVFCAIKNDELIDVNEINGIAAYIDNSRNRIYDQLEFSLENSICGFAIKSGFGNKSRVHYTMDINKWNSPCRYIDIPFAGIDINNFKNSAISITDGAELAANKKAIDEIIEFIFQ